MNTRKILTTFSVLLAVVLSLGILLATIHGEWGNPTEEELLEPQWIQGPFELSPERGRYALTYSILENNSFVFSPELAAFAAPDVAFQNNEFVSLFPPGLSYLVMPGYLVGKYYNVAQVGSFFMIAVFAVCNVVLIYAISRKVGAHSAAALCAGLIFLFATPAFAYAVTLYQHHVTTLLLLLCIWILVVERSRWLLAIVWFCCVFAVILDLPNFFFFLPAGILAISRLVTLEETKTHYTITILFRYVLTFIVVAVPLAFFIHFNTNTYGNPWQLGGTLSRAKGIEIITDSETNVKKAVVTDLEQSTVAKKTAVSFFRSRNIPNGLYTHLFAWDRGMLFFTPVVLLGIIGIPGMLRRKTSVAKLCIATIGFIVLLYSLWGDPYGGWAFGSRYLIPVYALLCIFLAMALTRYRKNILFFLVFCITVVYSLVVNTAGALTSNANPPSVELVALQQQSGLEQRSGFERNFAQISDNQSKSIVFRTWGKEYVNLAEYLYIVVGLLSIFVLSQVAMLVVSKKSRE